MSGRSSAGMVAGLFLLASSLSAKPVLERNTLEFEGNERSYHLFVPEQAAAGEPLPLIILLHGSGRDGRSLLDKWRKLAVREGIILAGAEALDSAGWAVPSDGPGFLHALVERLIENQPIDPRRVYLFGHSSGAVFGLQMAVAESQYFAAVAVHAGALRPENYVFIDFAKRLIPIYIVSGTDDGFFPLDSVRATRDALVAKRIPVELVELKGHDHWYYTLAPKINEGVWEFLAQHRLEEAPYYEAYQ